LVLQICLVLRSTTSYRNMPHVYRLQVSIFWDWQYEQSILSFEPTCETGLGSSKTLRKRRHCVGLLLVGGLGTVLDPIAVLLVLSVRKWSEEQCSLIFNLCIRSKNYMKCLTYRGTVHDPLRTDIAIAASRHLPIPANGRQLNHWITKTYLWLYLCTVFCRWPNDLCKVCWFPSSIHLSLRH